MSHPRTKKQYQDQFDSGKNISSATVSGGGETVAGISRGSVFANLFCNHERGAGIWIVGQGVDVTIHLTQEQVKDWAAMLNAIAE